MDTNNSFIGRVWYIANPPAKPHYTYVTSIDQAKDVLRARFEKDLNNPNIWCNVGGLETFEDAEWTEWYDADTDLDIVQIMDKGGY